MDGIVFLQHLCDPSLEEGRAYIQLHEAELADRGAFGDLLADEALKQLYKPFLSLKLAELLIFFGEFTSHSRSRALGLKAKGDVLVQISHYQAAMECLNAAGEEFLHLGDKGDWARSRISWVVAAAWLGRVEEALQQASLARDEFLRRGELYWCCVIDHNTAIIYSHIGRYQNALAMYERVLEIYPTLSDQGEIFIERSIAMAEVNQGLNLARLGKFGQAYRLQRQAQVRFIALGETSQAINAEIHLADLDYTQGYYGSALRRYYQAQDTLMEHNVDNPRLHAELKLQLASTLLKLNRASDACELARQAVEIYRQPDMSLPTSNALREYAATLTALGRLQEAVAVLNEAYMHFEQGGFNHHAAAARLQRAELLLEMGRVTEAYEEARAVKEYFEARGLVVARSTRANLVIVGSLIEQAQRLQEKAQQASFLQEAMSLCQQTALQARQHHLQEEIYKSQYLLGRLFLLQGDASRAARHYEAAIAQIERILDDLAFDLSPSFLHAAWTVYEDMIALCLQQQRVERAFTYLERARSTALRQYLLSLKEPLEQGEWQVGSVSSPMLQAQSAAVWRTRGELKSWQERYRRYSLLLEQLDISVSPTVERGIIEAELRRCEAKLSEMFERLYLQQATRLIPRTKKGDRLRAKQPGVAQLRQRLLPNQLLLAYFLYKGEVVIFAVTGEHIIAHRIPDGMQKVKRWLPFLHAHLQPGGWPDPRQPPRAGVLRMLNKLYDLLLAPVVSLCPAPPGCLTIVPYGPLHTLPFHALYDGSHFLIEHFQVNYLPASNLPGVPASDTPMIMLKQGDRLTEAQGNRTQPLIFGCSGHGHLQRAVEEAKELGAMLGGRCYLEDEATIARLIDEAPGSPIIHLATHGHSRLDAPNFSAILLADGRFNAIDAFGLNLKKCELVTLSGCETGLALGGGGDEQLGLGRAFLAAGASSLVMSLWSVEDQATSELMQLFYRHLLHGESKADALRAAQCAFIHRTASTYSHPYYWAAFRLVGEMGSLKYQIAEDALASVKADSEKVFP
jgi:tetratricopeptide (TPR) repeat protein